MFSVVKHTAECLSPFTGVGLANAALCSLQPYPKEGVHLSLEGIFLVTSEALVGVWIGCLVSSIHSDFPSRLPPVSAGGKLPLGA